MTRAHKRTAMERAAAVWGQVALDGRSQLRASGVRGDLRPLDEQASGRRGRAVPRGVSRLAIELHEAGMPATQIRALLTDALDEIVGIAVGGPGAA